ncbi:hypothetical protein [Streptomyces sp. NPDC055243]|uniref:hypothetical protein n=1 Tax=Streptomyces sp. NPDC055243 TaxID=3365720 RepID=UPI0037CECCF4
MVHARSRTAAAVAAVVAAMTVGGGGASSAFGDTGSAGTLNANPIVVLNASGSQATISAEVECPEGEQRKLTAWWANTAKPNNRTKFGVFSYTCTGRPDVVELTVDALNPRTDPLLLGPGTVSVTMGTGGTGSAVGSKVAAIAI